MTEGTKLVFPAAGWQHTLMKKEFTPEGMLFGHNTLYFANPKNSATAKEFVAWYGDKFKDYPEWEADRAYFAVESYKQAVEKAKSTKLKPVADNLKKMKFDTVLGSFTFDKKGDVTAPGYVMYEWKDGKYDYFEGSKVN